MKTRPLLNVTYDQASVFFSFAYISDYLKNLVLKILNFNNPHLEKDTAYI
jgi:hypothetical protein